MMTERYGQLHSAILAETEGEEHPYDPNARCSCCGGQFSKADWPELYDERLICSDCIADQLPLADEIGRASGERGDG